MPQTALYPGNEDRIGYWLTPPDMMAKLQTEFNFNFDACPYPRPAGFDGLKEEWGTRTWVNPPFRAVRRGTGISAWAKKSLQEFQKGKLVVMIKPVRKDISYFLQAGAALEIRFLGPVDWRTPENRSIHNTQDQALFILRPFTSGHPNRNEMEAKDSGTKEGPF